MDDSTRSGVCLGALRELAGRVAAGVGVGASIAAIVDSIIRPSTQSRLCSYAELLPDDDRGVPSTVVIAPWGMSFCALVDVLTQEHNANTVKSSFIWVDVLSCNLHHTDTDDRFDTASHAATVVSSAPSRAETDAPALTMLPASALESYRQAIRTVASSSSSPSAATATIHDLATDLSANTSIIIALDADATVLASPWCLYGIWSYMNHSRPAIAGGQLAAITPLCVGALDALLTHMAWENLSLLSASPHTSDALHAAILEDVAAEEPIPLPPEAVTTATPVDTTAAAKQAAAGPQRDGIANANGAGNGGGVDEQENDAEARVAAADGAIKYGILTAFRRRLQSVAASTDAITSASPQSDESAKAAGHTTAVEPPPTPQPASASSEPATAAAAATADTTAEAMPTSPGGPPSRPPAMLSADRLRALASVSDAYGCLLWAAGRPAEGERHLRRARELAAGLPQPLLPLTALVHLGGLLHVLPESLDGDEAELLLRGAIARLDAARDTAGVAAARGSGGGGSGSSGDGDGDPCAPPAAALLSAHARLFLARLLCLRTAAAATSHFVAGASGLHHLRRHSVSPLQGAATAYPAASGSSSKAVSGESRTGSARRDASAGGGGAAVATAAAVAAAAAAAGPQPLSGSASLQLPPGCAPAEAVPLLRAALPVFTAHYGGEHPLTATLLSNMAMALKDQGKQDEAEALLRRALAAREATHGSGHLDTMRCMNNLAGLLEAQGELEEAEVLLRRAAELAAAGLGPDHVYTASALSNLGLALRKAGKLEEAEELFRTALEIREKLLGPLALDTAASLGDMTLLLMDTGRLAEAEPLLRRILDIRQLVLGPDHRDTAAALCDLAALLSQMDRPMEAEPLLRRAVSVQVRCLGPGHEDTASATRELGKVLAQQGQEAEAEKLCRRALAVMESVLGPNQPETVITVNQLAVLLKETGRSAEAEALFQRVLSLTDSLDLDANADADAANPAARAARRRLRAAAMIAMRGLAELADAAGRLEEAEVLSCRALVASEGALGSTHPVTLACAEGLAEVLRQLGLLEDAAELYARLVETLAEEQGEDSEQVVRTLGLYEAVYAEMVERDRESQQHGEDEEDDGDDDGEGRDDAEGDDAAREAASTAAASHTTKHVRIASSATAASGAAGGIGAGTARSAESVGSIMSTLLGPLGRSITVKRRAAAARRLQSRGSENSSTVVGGDARGGLHHSFASFVSRRSQPQTPGKARAASRAQSIVSRVHSSLVATGRIGAGGPLGDARKRQRAAAASSRATSAASGIRVVGDEDDADANGDADADGVSPGLPRMGQAEDAAAGASTVALDAPPPPGGAGRESNSGCSGGSLKAGAASGYQAQPEEVYDPSTVPLITASGFGYGSVTVSGGAGGGHRSVSGRLPGGVVLGRRSSVDTAVDVRRSVTNSMISIRGGISKKALLQQANIDLDDEEEDDRELQTAAGAAGARKPMGDVGRASRRAANGAAAVGGGGGGGASAEDDSFEDTAAVGCCGFGSGARRRVRPTA